MTLLINRTRKPVKRKNAQYYVLITLISFALSVLITRLYLTLTGFPKIGGGDFHIAHVLWGGLLLFASGLLPLILANRWALTAAAVLNGIGVGLFIDEVGKFITMNNDYFSPLAAPIIYGFFLITVMFYLRVRRPPSSDPRAELYRAFDAMQELLDRDLEPDEKEQLLAQLRSVSQSDQFPDLAQLATVLSNFVSSDIYLAAERTTWIERALNRSHRFEKRFVGRRRLKMALVSGLVVFSFVALIEPALTLFAATVPGAIQDIASRLVREGTVQSATSLQWFFIKLCLEGIAGMILIAAFVALLTGREKQGIDFAYFGLIFSLMTVNLLTFYFNQFGNVFLALVQFGFLMSVIYYRKWYLPASLSSALDS